MDKVEVPGRAEQKVEMPEEIEQKIEVPGQAEQKVEAPEQTEQKMEVPEPTEQEKQAPGKKKCPRLRKFLKNFFLWVAGAAIGVVPVFLKQIEVAALENFPVSYDLWQMTLSDFDFSFTSVNALFVLFLEGCLLNDEFPAWKDFIRACVFLCLIITGAVYLISFPRQEYFFSIWKITPHDYNMLTLCLTIGFGFLCHIAISLRKGETL